MHRSNIDKHNCAGFMFAQKGYFLADDMKPCLLKVETHNSQRLTNETSSNKEMDAQSNHARIWTQCFHEVCI